MTAPAYLCHVRHCPTGQLRAVTIRTHSTASVGELARYRACIEQGREAEKQGRHGEAWCLTDVVLAHSCLMREATNARA